MSLSTWWMYACVALISIVSPGPAILLAIRNSLRYGARSVALSSAGNGLGLLLVSALAMAGVGAMLQASPALFFVLKLAGAGYLLYLGVKQWTSQHNVFAQIDARPAGAGKNRWQLFRQGLLMALSNPKAILFFSALFPQFIEPTHALAPQFCILTGTFMAISFCSLMSYGMLARSAKNWLAGQRRHVVFNKCFGALFMLLGAAMLSLKTGAH